MVPGDIGRLILVLSLTCVLHPHEAQRAHVNYEHLSAEDGLSSDKVLAVHQDAEGFYWIATQNGLNRFDGTTFRVYRHKSNDSTSITHNHCAALAETRNGDIWVATYSGVSRFVRSSGVFQRVYVTHPHYNFEITNRISGIVADTADQIWIHGPGLWRYDITQDTIEMIYPTSEDVEEKRTRTFVSHIAYDVSLHGLWMTTDRGLMMMDLREDRLLSVRDNPQGWTVFGYGDPDELACDTTGNLWFLDHSTTTLKSFDPKLNTITNSQVHMTGGLRKMAVDHLGKVWLCYWGRPAEIYDPVSETIDTWFLSDAYTGADLMSPVNSVYTDRTENLWISSGQGISIYHRANQFYQVYRIVPGPDNTPQFEITALAELDSVHFWVGTPRGLFVYAADTDELHAVEAISVQTPVLALCTDGDLLWIGTTTGLKCLDVQSGKVLHDIPLSSRVVRLVKEDPDTLWVASWDKGLYCVDTHSGNYTQYTASPGSGLSSNFLVSAHLEGSRLWVGYNGGGGFSRLEHGSEVSAHLPPAYGASASRSAGTITAITHDLYGHIWLGTYGHGVFRYAPRTDAYDHFDQEDGLFSNYINSIVIDSAGLLWISTADGLNVFHPDQGIIRKIDLNLVFDSNDLVSNGERGSRGSVLFFCKDRIVRLYPGEYIPQSGMPRLVVSSFRIFDKEIPLPSGGKGLHLSHRENFFSFEYSLLRTHPGKEVQYAYRLDGFDAQWNESLQNFASYTNVPGGDYRFEVRAAYAEGQWSDVLLSIPIRVRPPFWRTWWFAVLMLGLITGSIIVFYRLRIAQIRRIYAIRSKISQDLHDDVGASLSSIYIYSSVAEKALESDMEKAGQIIHQIKHNSRQVLESMGDIVWSMNTGRARQESLASRIKNYGYELLAQKNIACQYEVDAQLDKKLQQPEARKRVLLLVKEAMHNIAKYSEATRAEIHISIAGSQLRIRISDNGKGFDPSLVNRGNGLGNMQDRVKALGGKFHLESSPGQGTVIESDIPVRNVLN